MYNQRIEEFFSVYSGKKEELNEKTENLYYDFKKKFNIKLKTKFIYLK